MEPLVSVIMSVYNTPEKWLKESIESILAQSFKRFEFIIVLDCPTDNSEIVVEYYMRKDERIRVVRNEKNIGLTKSLNIAISLAKGKYIARMDADDVSLPERLATQIDYMESHPEVAVVGSYICSFGDEYVIQGRSYDDMDVFRIRMLFYNDGIAHPTAIIRKSILLEYNIKYNESIKKSQDYCLWSELMWYGSITEVPKVLLLYRIHDRQISFETRSSIDKVNQKSAEIDTQPYYAHVVSLLQAERLLGKLSEEEKHVHICVNMYDENIYNDDVDTLYHYLQKIISVNQKKGLYNQRKLVRELKLIWCVKAFVRMRRTGKSDMIFTRYFLKNVTFAFAQEIINIYKTKIRNLFLLKNVRNRFKKNEDYQLF